MMRTRLLTLTTLGQPISVVENDVADADLRLLFIGGVHGDEPEGVHLATEFLRWLKTHTAPFACAVIPCLNPDGAFATPSRRTNARGVDLNRNFPSQDWSAASRAPRYFPGSHAGSELETRALVSFMHEWKPCLVIHFHSYSEPCIVYTGAPGRTISEIFSRASGYPAKEDIGYPTPGSLGQYGWYDCQIPVICIEEKEGIALSSIWPRFEKGFAELLQNPRAILPRASIASSDKEAR